MDIPQGIITIAALGSQPVLVFLTQAIVAATKELRPFAGIPTLLYAWGVAAVLVTLGYLGVGISWTAWTTYLLGGLNGIIVAFAAGKANDLAVKPPVRLTGPDEGR